MISKSKRKNKKNIANVMDINNRPELSSNDLPAAYRHLLSLIFFSSEPLIHKVQSHDKVSS
jgi:hypothetical protein